jgi:hypothetical protein
VLIDQKESARETAGREITTVPTGG